MVSIRRRKLMGGRNSLLTPENFVENIKPPLPLDVSNKTKEETTFEIGPGSSNASAFSPSKECPFHQFPEIKRRKRHRRKHVENQEPCTMRGVYFKNSRWQAAIKVDKKQIHLGTVGSQEDAARLYDRAAFMCGREPNFELSMEEKQELNKFKWEEFLAYTRSAITNRKSQRRPRSVSLRKHEDDDLEGNSFSASEDEDLAH